MPAERRRQISFASDAAMDYGNEVRTDFCYRSKRLPGLHFGLGTLDRADVRITMPRSEPPAIEGLAAGQVHTLNLRDAAEATESRYR
jgi:hypothetical protein